VKARERERERKGEEVAEMTEVNCEHDADESKRIKKLS
jgi:hypothetical protein